MKINKIKIQHTEGPRNNQMDTFDFKKYDNITCIAEIVEK